MITILSTAFQGKARQGQILDPIRSSSSSKNSLYPRHHNYKIAIVRRRLGCP